MKEQFLHGFNMEVGEETSRTGHVNILFYKSMRFRKELLAPVYWRIDAALGGLNDLSSAFSVTSAHRSRLSVKTSWTESVLVWREAYFDFKRCRLDLMWCRSKLS